MAKRTVFRTCPLCEATCGLELHLDGDELTLVRGDKEDVFSHGYLCPKGTALKALEADPDRLRRPQVRTGDTWREVTWDEAFAEIERGLGPILEADRNAVGVYLGNPNAHNLGAMIEGKVLLQALGTENVFSASTVDQMPKQVSAGRGSAPSAPAAVASSSWTRAGRRPRRRRTSTCSSARAPTRTSCSHSCTPSSPRNSCSSGARRAT